MSDHESAEDIISTDALPSWEMSEGDLRLQVALDESFAITFECDRRALGEHLAHLLTLRLLDPKGAVELCDIEEKGGHVTVHWKDNRTETEGLRAIAAGLITRFIAPHEREGWSRLVKSRMEQFVPIAAINLSVGMCILARRAMAVAVQAALQQPVPAPRFDEVERIPVIGVARQGRGGARNVKVQLSANNRCALRQSYTMFREQLRPIKKLYSKVRGYNAWREMVIGEFPGIPADVVERLAEAYAPSDLAIELAARATIADYSAFSLTARRLKQLIQGERRLTRRKHRPSQQGPAAPA